MNSYFRLLSIYFCFFAFLFVVKPANALNLVAIYTSACTRHMGTIVNVGTHQFDFLTIGGQVKRLKPHQVIFLAYYPVDKFPVSGPIDIKSVDQLKLYTKVGTENRPLLKGWPIGFTEDKISILTHLGQETVISKRSIYKLKYIKNITPLFFKSSPDPKKFHFVHPYSFRDCPDTSKTAKRKKIYPQQVLSDAIMIKRELDALAKGHQRVRRYLKEQSFYPTPEVHKNETTLGIWHNFGSRYGSSTKRSNNITPVLTDSYSSDIFDYQHVFVTGSAPNYLLAHDEAQTQAFYSFKASYFHFSALADPSLILVGQRYPWQEEDLSNFESRMNQVSLLEMGFDYSSFTIKFFLSDHWSYGVKTPTEFVAENISIGRLGLSYSSHAFDLDISGGSGLTDLGYEGTFHKTVKASLTRINFTPKFFRKIDVVYSFINRTIQHNAPSWIHDSSSQTHAFYSSLKIKRYRLGGSLALENLSSDFSGSVNESSTNSFVKFGLFGSLSF